VPSFSRGKFAKRRRLEQIGPVRTGPWIKSLLGDFTSRTSVKRARFKKDPGGLGGWVFRSLLKPGLEATMKISSSTLSGEGRDWGGNVISDSAKKAARNILTLRQF